MLRQEDVQKMANEIHHGVQYTSEKKKSMLNKYNRRLVLNTILNSLLYSDVSAVLLLFNKNPEVARKLIFAGFVVAMGSIASLIALSNSFKDKNGVNKQKDDKELGKFIDKTLKDDAKFEKEFHKYMEKQRRKER